MKKALPITIPPFVTYQGIAFNMIVILANDNLKNYMYNHFIQWTCTQNYIEDNDFYIKLQCSSYFNNEYLDENICINKSIFKTKYKELIKQFIDNGRYIAVDGFDIFYLENGQGYKEYHFSHDAMIYGYDDEKEIYNIVSYDKHHFFKPYLCSYEALGESLNSTEISDEGVAFGMIKNTDEFIPLDIKKIKETILQYLDGEKYLTKYDNKDIYMGVTVYEHTIKWLKSDQYTGDIKFLRLIMEHKIFMKERLEKIGVDEVLIKQYKKISDTSIVMWNVALKYSLTNKKELVEDIIEMIEYIWSEEVAVLSKVIKI